MRRVADQPLPLEYGTSAGDSTRDIARATAIGLGMVAAIYLLLGLMYVVYVKRGVPLPMEGSWRWYMFGIGAGMAVLAVASLRWTLAGAAGAMALFVAANVASILQDPGSVLNGALVKVVAFIILLRTLMQALEARGRGTRKG